MPFNPRVTIKFNNQSSMQDSNQTNALSYNKDGDSVWFSGFIDKVISNLQADKFMLETNTAPDNIKSFYSAIMGEDYLEVSRQNAILYTRMLISQMLHDYVIELKSATIATITPNKIAFDLSEAKLLVWAEIKNNDESTEDGLLLTEAKINAKFINKGAHISSFIVEESDNFPVPKHYKSIPLA